MATLTTQFVEAPKNLRAKRNDAIRSEYAKLYASGKRNEWILNELSERYYLATDTIERIVWGKGHYQPKGTE